MAVSAIAKQSEDKRIRQAYERRKDEVYFYNLERAEDREELEQSEQVRKQLAIENEILRKRLAEFEAQANNKCSHLLELPAQQGIESPVGLFRAFRVAILFSHLQQIQRSLARHHNCPNNRAKHHAQHV